MEDALKVGIIGCGDFLRWQAETIKRSSDVRVVALFDTEHSRAARYAGVFGAEVRSSAQEIIADPHVDLVCLFVPPWVRRDLLVACAAEGKSILTTKPLGPTVTDCAAMLRAVENHGVRCGVIYRRTDNAVIETYKRIFESGEIGRLALYKQDWIHHYPQWNNWALDPKKNGGPFMDAMIHNLNIARYLMGRKPTAVTFFSESYAHRLPCADTEFMKLDFEDSGSAHLFITWAADLAVYSTDGNDREHIDICYMVTDKGWRLTDATVEDRNVVVGSREGQQRLWEIVPLNGTLYDRFAECILGQKQHPRDIPDIREAYEDIKLLKEAEKCQGRRCRVSLTMPSRARRRAYCRGSK